MTKLYKRLAGLISAYNNCVASGNSWSEKHKEEILKLCEDKLPHGAGIDNGTQIDLERSTDEKLVFTTSYHHMNNVGMYDGWTDHTVIVTASLAHYINIRITGKNRNDIKDYLHEVFLDCLSGEVE